MLEILTIGEIVNVHGVKGALKVQPLTDNPLRFKKLKNVVFFYKLSYNVNKI